MIGRVCSQTPKSSSIAARSLVCSRSSLAPCSRVEAKFCVTIPSQFFCILNWHLLQWAGHHYDLQTTTIKVLCIRYAWAPLPNSSCIIGAGLIDLSLRSVYLSPVEDMAWSSLETAFMNPLSQWSLPDFIASSNLLPLC